MVYNIRHLNRTKKKREKFFLGYENVRLAHFRRYVQVCTGRGSMGRLEASLRNKVSLKLLYSRVTIEKCRCARRSNVYRSYSDARIAKSCIAKFAIHISDEGDTF